MKYKLVLAEDMKNDKGSVIALGVLLSILSGSLSYSLTLPFNPIQLVIGAITPIIAIVFGSCFQFSQKFQRGRMKK